jgi:hypothetical protein
MFQKKGNKFPGGNDRESGASTYAVIIANALRTDLGDTHRAVKTVMRWTGASERAIKHWFSGLHGPGGAHLLTLMRESEAVFEAVLMAEGRHDVLAAARVLAARSAIIELTALFEQQCANRAPTVADEVEQQGRKRTSENDPEDDRVSDPVNRTPRDDLNPRQRWYLDVLTSGANVRAQDLQRWWRVSEKTARRDVAGMKSRGLVEFVGSCRTGRYRLSRRGFTSA